ncbi:MAG TPA: succinate dehydrogenase assembly factor 2 [Micavibrio sp.]
MTLEEIQNWRKRLIFRSWHRGTREMDLIMGSFADQNVPGFDEAALQAYESLLETPDPDLYNWISGVETPPADQQTPMLARFLSHKFQHIH